MWMTWEFAARHGPLPDPFMAKQTHDLNHGPLELQNQWSMSKPIPGVMRAHVRDGSESLGPFAVRFGGFS